MSRSLNRSYTAVTVELQSYLVSRKAFDIQKLAVQKDFVFPLIRSVGLKAATALSRAVGKSRGAWNTKIHMVAADARTTVVFALSPGHDHDAPHGRALLEELGPMPEGLPLLMDRARIALRTQQFIAYKTGATNTTDPVGGSEYVENLTDEIEDGVKRILDEIEKTGGTLNAIETRWVQQQI